MTISIRRLSPDDVDAWASLDAACFGRGWSSASCRAELGRADAILIGAFTPGELIGYACARLGAGEAELHRIAVSATARRAGVGRDLLTGILEATTAARANAVYLEVGAQNSAAVGLYRSLGFEIVGRRPGYYRDPPDDALLMRWAAESRRSGAR